jgi:DNA mismatch endonuclease (patch repair protein)
MDIWSEQKRSEVMRNILSKNTKPEIVLRSWLFNKGYRFRIHMKSLAGKPDIVFLKFKIVIFVHGCFWHKHQNCSDGRIPKTNINYWGSKLQKNIENDMKNEEILRKAGWDVIVVWECEIQKKPEVVLARIISRMDLKIHTNLK